MCRDEPDYLWYIDILRAEYCNNDISFSDRRELELEYKKQFVRYSLEFEGIDPDNLSPYPLTDYYNEMFTDPNFNWHLC